MRVLKKKESFIGGDMDCREHGTFFTPATPQYNRLYSGSKNGLLPEQESRSSTDLLSRHTSYHQLPRRAPVSVVSQEAPRNAPVEVQGWIEIQKTHDVVGGLWEVWLSTVLGDNPTEQLLEQWIWYWLELCGGVIRLWKTPEEANHSRKAQAALAAHKETIVIFRPIAWFELKSITHLNLVEEEGRIFRLSFKSGDIAIRCESPADTEILMQKIKAYVLSQTAPSGEGGASRQRLVNYELFSNVSCTLSRPDLSSVVESCLEENDRNQALGLIRVHRGKFNDGNALLFDAYNDFLDKDMPAKVLERLLCDVVSVRSFEVANKLRLVNSLIIEYTNGAKSLSMTNTGSVQAIGPPLEVNKRNRMLLLAEQVLQQYKKMRIDKKEKTEEVKSLLNAKTKSQISRSDFCFNIGPVLAGTRSALEDPLEEAAADLLSFYCTQAQRFEVDECTIL